MLFSRFFQLMHQCTFWHITAKLAEVETLIGAMQRQIYPASSFTKFCVNLKQKTQILSVFIAHANTVPIAQSGNR